MAPRPALGNAGHDRDRRAANRRAGSHEEFITEHYWGYTARRGCSEYRVEHPRWRLWTAEDDEVRRGRRDPLRTTICRTAGRAARLRLSSRKARPSKCTSGRTRVGIMSVSYDYLRAINSRNTNGKIPPWR